MWKPILIGCTNKVDWLIDLKSVTTNNEYVKDKDKHANALGKQYVRASCSPMQTFFCLIMQSSLNKWQEEMCDEALRMSVWEATNQNSSFFQALHNRGGSRIFFRRGHTRLLLYFNANKPHSFFFLQNTSCIRKPQVISGGCAPPSPSP